MDITAMIQRNMHKARYPDAGDYWHEQLSPFLLVIRVDGNSVYVLRNKVWRENSWYWDVSEFQKYTREEFVGVVKGYWVMEQRMSETVLAALGYHWPRLKRQYLWRAFKRWCREAWQRVFKTK